MSGASKAFDSTDASAVGGSAHLFCSQSQVAPPWPSYCLANAAAGATGYALCHLLPQTAFRGVSQIICMPSLQERLWKRAVAHALAHEAASADWKALLQRTTQGRELLEQSLARVSQLMMPFLAGVVKH